MAQELTEHADARTQTVADRIVGEVIALFEKGGPDAVGVRVVARRARVSLRDIYRIFGSRDELIVAAVRVWMTTNIYQPIEAAPEGTPPFDALSVLFHQIFAPFEHNQGALEAFVYAVSTSTGDLIRLDGEAAAEPSMRAVLSTLDADLATDVRLILTSVVYGILGQVAAGQVAIEDMAPTIDRVLRRLAKSAAAS